jgi:hypothetical protein
MVYKGCKLEYVRCWQIRKTRDWKAKPIGTTNCSYWRIIFPDGKMDTALTLPVAKKRITALKGV